MTDVRNGTIWHPKNHSDCETNPLVQCAPLPAWPWLSGNHPGTPDLQRAAQPPGAVMLLPTTGTRHQALSKTFRGTWKEKSGHLVVKRTKDTSAAPQLSMRKRSPSSTRAPRPEDSAQQSQRPRRRAWETRAFQFSKFSNHNQTSEEKQKNIFFPNQTPGKLNFLLMAVPVFFPIFGLHGFRSFLLGL